MNELRVLNLLAFSPPRIVGYRLGVLSVVLSTVVLSWFGGLFCERIICNFVFGKNVRFCHFSKVKKIKMFDNELKCLKVVDMALFNILINTKY